MYGETSCHTIFYEYAYVRHVAGWFCMYDTGPSYSLLQETLQLAVPEEHLSAVGGKDSVQYGFTKVLDGNSTQEVWRLSEPMVVRMDLANLFMLSNVNAGRFISLHSASQ